MATVLARNWWALALRGVAAIVLGLISLFMPGVSLAALVLLFGAYALVDGVLALTAAFRGPRAARPWWWLALEGLVSLGAGVATLVVPAVTAVVLVYLVAAWALVTGALEIGAAVRLRREITGEWRMVLGGVLSLVLGALLMLAPTAGALALVLWLGAYALVFGVVLVALAFRVRAIGRDREEPLRRAA